MGRHCHQEHHHRHHLHLHHHRRLPHHQVCYGIDTVPDGEWYCQRCELPNAQRKRVRCPACPLATGAFKRTRNGEDGGWAHVTCTLYHQNMGFDKPKTMDVVRWDASRTGRRTHSRAAPQQLTPLLPLQAAGYQYIPEGLKKLKCSLCPAAGRSAADAACGAKVQCAYGKCMKAFHVSCALADPALSSTLEGGKDGATPQIFCAAHATHADGGGASGGGSSSARGKKKRVRA